MRTLCQVCAIWLVTLIVAPFTAPFSIGDVSPSLKNASSHALPVARGSRRLDHRLKQIAVAAVPAHTRRPRASRARAVQRLSASPFSNSPLVLPLRI
jgi:hypothetical protein